MIKKLTTSISVFILLLACASLASAAPPKCVGASTPKTLYSDQGSLESVIVGNSGRLYFSSSPTEDPTVSRLLRVNRPGAKPRTLLDGPDGPGGLAWGGRKLLWGVGNTSENGSVGDVTPHAGLYRVSPVTGKRKVLATTLGMANGIIRAPGGDIFASNDLGTTLDRISPTGVVKNHWATVASPNGMTVSPNGKYLFVNQTFVASSSVARIKISNPSVVTTYFQSPADDGNSIFDGLTRDAKGNLYVASWGTGEVWRIDTRKRACVVTAGLDRPSSLIFGRGKKRFKAGNLYVVGFGGDIVKVPRAIKARFPG